MRIAISKASGASSYEKYAAWLQAVDPQVEVVDMIGLAPEEAQQSLRTCDGLILSGGPDVAPERYAAPDQRVLCASIDETRDALEFALVDTARELNIPVLGICRGAQLLNVAFGGTLVADIPTQRPSDIEHRQLDNIDARHTVHVEPGSILKSIARVMDSEVNSAHHQAVDRLATLFTPSAMSSDGLVEAFEWGDATMGGKPFLLAVQWHPERMAYEEPLSLNIAVHFLNEADAYATLLRTSYSTR